MLRGFSLLLLLALFGLGFASPAQAGKGVHTCRGKGGVVTYTNLPCNRQHAVSGVASGGTNSGGVASARQEVYYKHRQNGVVVFSSRPPRGRTYQTVLVGSCFACGRTSPINWNSIVLNTRDYATEVSQAAGEYGVDVALVRALIHAESGFNPLAVSNKGAQGLMQLMPSTASAYGVTDAFDAAQNIRAGVRHLAGLLRRYGDDIDLVAAAYNAGEGAVSKYKGTVPPYPETQVYVQRVAILHRRYQAALAGLSTG